MKKKSIGKIVLYVILAFLAVIYLIPIVMMVLGSFKTQGEALLFDLRLPKVFLWSNYQYIFQKGNILRAYGNSIFITCASTLGTILFGAFAGIVVGRRVDKKSKVLYYYFMLGLTITLQIASTFVLLKALNLYGNYMGVILLNIAFSLPFTIMTFSSFVIGIPREIDEAAIIDGCGVMGLIWKILIPIMKPIMMTNIIVTAINAWNNFMIPLFFLDSSKKWTVPLMVYSFFGRYARDWQYVFGVLTLTAVPMILLFLLLQKYIIGGMTAGAVKG